MAGEERIVQYFPLLSRIFGCSSNITLCSKDGFSNYMAKYMSKIDTADLVEKYETLHNGEQISEVSQFLVQKMTHVSEAI